MNSYTILVRPEEGFTLHDVEENLQKLTIDDTGFTNPEIEIISKNAYVFNLNNSRWSSEKVKDHLEKLLGDGMEIIVETR